jgi:Ca2+-binding RTX toxin-like protein
LDAPDVVSEHLVVFTQDSGVGKALYQVQASDLDGDTLSYAIVGGNDDGLFTIDAETGVISSTGVLKPDAAVIAETFDLTVAVSDGTFTTESAITIEVQDDANILVEEAQTGQLLDGELGGNDLLQLTAQDGQGRYVNTLGRFNETYRNLETINNIDDDSPYAYTVYTRGFTGELDGEVVTVDGELVRSSLETALDFGNVVTNIEGISGTEFRDDIYGNAGDEILLGQGGNDIVSGGGGDDTLNGGIGNDSLTGGAGADTFVIDDIDSTDRINDFSAEQGDQIDISALLLNYDAATDDLTDYVTLGVNQFNQQTIEVSINGDGDFTDVARFQSTEFRTTLEELLDSDSLFLG